MKNAVTRACAWVSFVLLTCAPLASAQNLEIFAGGARFVDVPGNHFTMMEDHARSTAGATDDWLTARGA